MFEKNNIENLKSNQELYKLHYQTTQ